MRKMGRISFKGIMAIGWDSLGNLDQYNSKEEISENYQTNTQIQIQI